MEAVMRHWAVGLVAFGGLLGAGPVAAQFDSGIAVGAVAPVVTISDLDGKPVDLGAYIGKKPVMLEFWATWCPLCKALYPQLARVKATYGDRVQMIGINVTVNDPRARVERYVARYRPPFLALYDSDGVSVRAYDVPSTSFIVVIDAGGKVVYTGLGEDQDLVAAVGKAVSR